MSLNCFTHGNRTLNPPFTGAGRLGRVKFLAADASAQSDSAIGEARTSKKSASPENDSVGSISGFRDGVFPLEPGRPRDGRWFVDNHGDRWLGLGDRIARVGDRRHRGFGLAHRTLWMNAATRIHRLVTDRTAQSGGDRRMEVLGVHPVSSGGKR